MSDALRLEFDPKSVERARKTLDKYRDRALTEKMRRATLQVARMLVGPIKAASPRRTGVLSNSVKASASRSSGAFGKAIGAQVGPTAPHRHLVIQPHRIVTPGGRDTGKRTTGNPFVDAATEPRIDEATRIVSQIVFEE